MNCDPITLDQAGTCFDSLWESAFKIAPFETVCALLRVSGAYDANWDTLEEAEEALKDYSWYLDAENEALSPKANWRIGLLTYCQIYEMSAVHSTLANLLRILDGKKCHLNPLGYLNREIKNKPFRYVPASAKVKWNKLREMAEGVGRDDLVVLIDSITHDSVRNAFSHSDYILTDEHFRWTEGYVPSQISLKEVDTLILNTFRFISGFIGSRNLWLEVAAKAPKYHKWPGYEVLELISSDEMRLVGFHLHFSNGSKATYKRTPDRVDCTNIIIQPDGTIEFMCGLINALKEEWLVDGQPVDFKDKHAVNLKSTG